VSEAADYIEVHDFIHWINAINLLKNYVHTNA
jgi:hypothetical protein